MGAQIATDGQWRFNGLDSVPNKMENCIRYFEDQYFFQHPGFNPISLFRAFKQNLEAGQIVSGGSTLTMQLVRISREGQDRTYFEKLIEIFYATKLEIKYRKSTILKMYLDNAPYGGNVVGVNAAAWRYFGRSPAELSWAESACLAVLPNAPSLIFPGRGQELLKTKRDRLLKKLLENEIISLIDYELAISEPIPEAPQKLPRLASHLMDYYRSKFDKNNLRSTLDYELQTRFTEVLNRHSNMLRHNQIYNAAAIVVYNKTKEIVAYIGNSYDKNKEHANEVDIIRSSRSSGSILKPLLFSAMMTEGYLLPNMLVADIPIYMEGFSPRNYNLTYDGAVPAKRALSRSLNIPSVLMLRDFRVKRFLEYLKSLGLRTIDQSADHYGLSVILGGAEVRLWDLAQTYSSMAGVVNDYTTNSGFYHLNAYDDLKFEYDIEEENEKENLMKEYKILSASSIYSCFNALLEVNRPESESGWEYFNTSRKIAWKTGTSFGFRDAWAVGVTPEYTVAVWVGNADGEGRPGLTGVTAAAPILFEIFDGLNTTWFNTPYNDMLPKKICKESGFLASANCPNVDTLWVTAQSNKVDVCNFHKMVHLDSTSSYQVSSNCYPQHKMIHKPWFVLPPGQEYYFKKKNPFYTMLPPLDKNCTGISGIKMMEFIYPRKNVNVYVPIDLDGNLSEVVFEVVHRNDGTKLYWHLDEEYLGSTEQMHQMGVTPGPGYHTISVVDQNGNQISRRFFAVEKY